MRRPRGPGGRFLTAEEIAAKTANDDDSALALNVDPDDDMDEDDTQPEAADHLQPIDRDSFMNHTSADHMEMLNLGFRQSIPMNHSQSMSHSMSHSIQRSIPSSSSQPSNQRSLPIQSSSASHNFYPQQPHHPSHKNATNPVHIPLGSPYSSAVQMHHIPHPHAHARHHHSNIEAFQSLFAPDSGAPNSEMERRTQEMIQLTGVNPSNA